MRRRQANVICCRCSDCVARHGHAGRRILTTEYEAHLLSVKRAKQTKASACMPPISPAPLSIRSPPVGPAASTSLLSNAPQHQVQATEDIAMEDAQPAHSQVSELATQLSAIEIDDSSSSKASALVSQLFQLTVRDEVSNTSHHSCPLWASPHSLPTNSDSNVNSNVNSNATPVRTAPVDVSSSVSCILEASDVPSHFMPTTVPSHLAAAVASLHSTPAPIHQ